jgi:hypothetical protein
MGGCASFSRALGVSQSLVLQHYRVRCLAACPAPTTDEQCDCTADVCICGALPPKRIHEDGTKCLKDHFVKVHKVHGTVVDGLGNRNGERRLKAVWSVKSKNHGGARPTRKQRLEEIETNGFGQVWVHRHARAEWHKCAGIEEEEVSMEESDSCDYCLHPDVCVCAFSKVTPGCCNKYNSE